MKSWELMRDILRERDEARSEAERLRERITHAMKAMDAGRYAEAYAALDAAGKQASGSRAGRARSSEPAMSDKRA
jgi:hypothetical protein